MPLNVGLAASARISKLDMLLRQERWWSKNELLNELNLHVEAVKGYRISEATLRNDLEELQDIAGDVLKIEKRFKNSKYYRYEDRNYSIFNIEELQIEDYDCLQQAIGLLEQIKGFAIAQNLELIITKLKYSYPKTDRTSMVLFDGPDHVEGIELLQQLYDAILCRQVILFDYQPFYEKEASSVILHPYLLKEFNNRWFLVGLTYPGNKIWTYALDRFKSDPRPRPKIGYIPASDANFDPAQHYKDVIGVTVDFNQPVEKVVLKFSKNRAPYILTKPLHNSQIINRVNKDGTVVIELQLRLNKELLYILLGFGSDVKILSPKNLIEQLQKETEKMIDNYK